MAHLPQFPNASRLAAIALFFLLPASTVKAQSAPPNDNFANPQVISGSAGAATGVNVGATKEPGEPNHAGNTGGPSVWYRWQAPASGVFTFTTLGSNFDTLLAVYTGASVSALTLVTANNDKLGITSTVSFNAVSGTTYRIVVDGVSGILFNNGEIVLNWFPPPANDRFAGALTISGGSGSLAGSSIGATKEPNEPSHAGNAGGASVWYRWQAPATGAFTFTTTGSNFDTLLAVYTGASVGALSLVAANDNKVDRASGVTFTATAGATYSIAVDGRGGDSGNIILNWAAPPVNDSFASAQPISGSTGSVTGNNAGATREPGEPNHAGGTGSASVWYRWQAPATGPVTFTTFGSEINTLLAVYTGASVGALSLVGANDDYRQGQGSSGMTFTAAAGAVYRIAIDGAFGFTGDLTLNWSPALANDLFVNARIISGSSGSVAGNNVTATKEPGEPDHDGSRGGASVWYRWQAPAGGLVAFTITSSDFNAILAIYTGSNVNALTPIASERGNRPARFQAVAGASYQIAVDGVIGEAGAFTLGWSFISQPGNNLFANAQVITGSSGSVAGSNLAATKEPGEPNHAGNAGGASVWYRWQAPASGPIIFTTADSGFDTTLAAYTGSVVSVLTGIVSNNDIDPGNNQNSRVRFNAAAGVTYRIAVDGFNGVAGNFVILWFPAPANDNFAGAQPISGSSGNVTGSNVGANKEPGEPNHAGGAGSSSVWYRWQAPATGAFTFNTVGSNFDTLLAVYTGASVGALSLVAGNNNRLGETSSVTFAATAGTTYRIAMDGDFGDTGNLVLRWSPSSLPGNNSFASAQAISGSSGSVAGSNIGATKEPGEPNHADTEGGASVWYRWQAPATGLAALTTLGSSFDTLLAVYTGTSLSSLTPVASATGNQTLRFNAAAGIVYHIAVDGELARDIVGRILGNEEGTLLLSWRLGAPANDNFAGAQTLSGSAGSITGNSLGATKQVSEPAHAGDAGGASVWYRWQAPASGLATMTTAGSSFDTLLAVYTGGNVSALALVAANDNFVAGASSVAFTAVAGTVYFIAVDGFDGQTGNVALAWSRGAPGNDNFAGAQAISGLSGAVAANNTDATKEPGEPNHAGNPGGRSVWYRWQAPVTGSVTFSTAGSTTDTVLAIYTGAGVNALSQVAANDDDTRMNLLTSKATFNAVAGTVYAIAVDGLGGRAGAVFLKWNVGARISGRVVVGCFGAGETATFATVTLSGDESRTILTDAAGYYTFANLRAGGNYVVAAFVSGGLRRAGLSDYSPLPGDVEDADFCVPNFIPTLSIAGRVKNARGAGVAGVMIVLSGAISETQVTGDSGAYIIFGVPVDATYTVTPTSSIHRFTPERRVFGDLAGDVIGSDFTASEAYTISGQIRQLNGAPLSGVTIALTGAQLPPVMSDSDGNYSFIVPAGGAYTVTPSLANFTFMQPSQTFTNLSQNQKTADFTAAPVTFAISGRVAVGSSGLGGVVMTLGGSASGVVSTDGNGAYAFISLAPGGNYTVAPARANFTFTPANLSFTNLSANQTNANFAAAPPSVTIAAADPAASEAGPDSGVLTVTRSGPATALLTVSYTIGGSAANGVDYDTIPTSISIPAGAASATITIRPKDDALVEGSESVTLTLAGSTDYLVGSPNAATVTIADNDTNPQPATATSVSAASFTQGTALAIESIVAAFGVNLSASQKPAETLPLPTTLNGTTVRLRDSLGAERLAPLFFVSPNQVNYQIPPGTVDGAATLSVTNGGTVVANGTLQVALTEPGLFTANSNGQGVAAAVVLRIKANGAQVFEPVAQFDAAQGRWVAVPIDLGPSSEQVFLVLYGTGIRFRSSLSAVTLKLGGADGQILFAGAAPDFVGLDQVNTPIPRSLIGRGEVDVVLTVGGRTANQVKVNIK